LGEPPKELGETPRSSGRIDSSSHCSPDKFGCRAAKEEMRNGLWFIAELAVGVS
jgi:hypothetical protein